MSKTEVKKVKRKRVQRQTVEEFQTWLKGIMTFREDDWAPDSEQWEVIFENIKNLRTDTTVQTNHISKNSLDKLEEIIEDKLNVIYTSLLEELESGSLSTPIGINEQHPVTQENAIPQPQAQPQIDLSDDEIRRKLEEAKARNESGMGVDPVTGAPNINKPPPTAKDFV